LGFARIIRNGGLAVLGLMRSVHFDAQGFRRTYWDFFSAFGLFFSVFLLFAAVLAWLLGGLPAETLARMRGICVGARHLLCGSHSFELEIRFHHPHRFLDPDYSVFDCGREAPSEDKLSFSWEGDRSGLGRVVGYSEVTGCDCE
jgi:hypothetical protein